VSLNLRIFIAYFIIVGAAIALLLNVFISELKPGIRQSTEETLVDMSNLLAELVADDFYVSQANSSKFDHQSFKLGVERFLERSYRAKIYSFDKPDSSLRIYMTDVVGKVVYDSANLAVGEDYSRWNDVYLTLRGKYGARSSLQDPSDQFSSVMHVAAPIKHGHEIIGVLTVAKPNISVQPFIDKARRKINVWGISLVVLSLFVAVALSYWLTRSIRQLVHYSDIIARGESSRVPNLRETELAKLANAIDRMRRQLEGKDYVEQYVHSLTHELKSPVSAIKGASEIINPEMSPDELACFMSNIQYEANRIDEMINRLLALAAIERRDNLQNAEPVDLVELVGQIRETKRSLLLEKQIGFSVILPESAFTFGDQFLLIQLLDNILQNAIDFSFKNSSIELGITEESSATSNRTIAGEKNTTQEERWLLTVRDHGEGIPDYAKSKIFDRFYSLARPITKKKSSGLGLSFVKQIINLHDGNIQIDNQTDGGVLVSIILSKIVKV